MKYEKSNLSVWNGIPVSISSPKKLGDGRLKATCYLRDHCNKQIASRQVTVPKAQTYEQLEEKIQKTIEVLALESADEIIARFVHSSQPELRLDTYIALRWDDICEAAKLARTAELYKVEWDSVLQKEFGAVNLLTCTDTTILEERMNSLTHRKRKKCAMDEKEKNWWILLDAVLSYAVKEALLPLEKSPTAHIAKKCKLQLSTIASKDLARQSLTDEEQRAFLRHCWDRIEQSQMYPAMVFQYSTGMTVYEVCGLSVEDWYCGNGISWLEISHMYYQPRGKEPTLTALLDSQYAYRKMPCTPITEGLLKHQLKILQEKGYIQSDKKTPLFVDENGGRLQPEIYKNLVHQVLDEVIRDGAKLTFVKRGSYLTGENRPTIFHGDMLRSTAEYNYRVRCAFPPEVIDVLIGRNPVLTYATNYVDWANELVLGGLGETIYQFWHKKMLVIDEQDIQNTRTGVKLKGKASAGASLRLGVAYGIEGVVKGEK